jgi:hypothetical protein
MNRDEIIKAEFERREAAYREAENKEAAKHATPSRQQKRAAKRKKTSTFDRWANGNQYGSFNSDED